MICGHGIDIVDIDRMRRIINRYGEHFITKYFGDEEIASATKLSENASFFASRFAAKEAFSKAVGTGFSGFGLRDVVVLREDSAPPCFAFSEKVEKAVRGARPEDFLLSISHEKNMAIASVIWQRGS